MYMMKNWLIIVEELYKIIKNLSTAWPYTGV